MKGNYIFIFWVFYLVLVPIWAYFIWMPNKWPKTESSNSDLVSWSKISVIQIVLTPLVTLVVNILIGNCCLKLNDGICSSKTNTHANDPFITKKNTQKDCLYLLEYYLHFAQFVTKSVWGCYGALKLTKMAPTNDKFFTLSIFAIEIILGVYMIITLITILTLCAFCCNCCKGLYHGKFAFDESNKKVSTQKLYLNHMSTLYGRESHITHGYEGFEIDLVRLSTNHEKIEFLKNSKYSHYYNDN